MKSTSHIDGETDPERKIQAKKTNGNASLQLEEVFIENFPPSNPIPLAIHIMSEAWECLHCRNKSSVCVGWNQTTLRVSNSFINCQKEISGEQSANSFSAFFRLFSVSVHSFQFKMDQFLVSANLTWKV